MNFKFTNLLRYVTNFTDQRPYWEANSRSQVQEITVFHGNVRLITGLKRDE
jgi:hypothetical protein